MDINKTIQTSMELIEENNVLIKTVLIIILLNVVASVAVMYYTRREQLHRALDDVTNRELTSSVKTVLLHLGLVLVVSCVIGYSAFRSMSSNQEYGEEVFDNLKLYYSNVQNLLVNLVPAGLTYVMTTDLVNKIPLVGDTESEAGDEVARGLVGDSANSPMTDAASLDMTSDPVLSMPVTEPSRGLLDRQSAAALASKAESGLGWMKHRRF